MRTPRERWRWGQAARLLLAGLLGGLFLLPAGCDGPLPSIAESEQTPHADDYMPFLTSSGYLVRWQAGSTITIENPPSCGGTTPCPSGANAAVDAGISAWASVLGQRGITLNIITIDTANDVQIVYDNIPGLSGILGYAQIDTSQDPSRKFVITTECCGGSPVPNSDTLIQTITVHEMGHMLGIWSHSFDAADIMYPVETGRTTLSSRDKATMGYLYGFTPDLNLSGLPANSLESTQAAGQSTPSGVALYETYSADPALSSLSTVMPADMPPPLHPDLQ